MDGAQYLAKVGEYHQNGWRLALINAISVLPAAGAEVGSYLIDLVFEKAGAVEQTRYEVSEQQEVPSITKIYSYAFIYENEIRDLFGVKITGIEPDFKGEIYRTATKVPFAPRAIRERLEGAKGKKQ